MTEIWLRTRWRDGQILTAERVLRACDVKGKERGSTMYQDEGGMER